MITIIDEKKVLQLAFADADYLPREIISSSDIRLPIDITPPGFHFLQIAPCCSRKKARYPSFG